MVRYIMAVAHQTNIERSVAIAAIRLTLSWRVEGELKLQLSAEIESVQLSAVADQPRLSTLFALIDKRVFTERNKQTNDDSSVSQEVVMDRTSVVNGRWVFSPTNICHFHMKACDS